MRVGLPYKVVGGTRFYERREVKDALAYLRVISNPADTVNLRRILNVPKRGIGDRAEACVAPLAERERIPFVAALGRAERRPRHRDPLGHRDQRLHRAARGAAHASTRRGSGVAGAARGGRSSRPATSPSCAGSHDPQDETRVENLAELVAVAREFDERAEPARGSLEDFLEQVSLVADADQIPDGDEAEEAGVVTLMTLHTAKGLEFPVVFLTGMEDGIFPHMRALGRPQGAGGGAAAGLRRHHPRPRAAAPVPRRGPRRLGAAAVQPAVALPRRDPGRAARLAAHRVATGVRPSSTARRGDPRRPPGRALARQPAGHRACRRRPGHARLASASARVVRVEGDGDKSMAHVDFGGDTGVKRLLLRYAPLEKL